MCIAPLCSDSLPPPLPLSPPEGSFLDRNMLKATCNMFQEEQDEAEPDCSAPPQPLPQLLVPLSPAAGDSDPSLADFAFELVEVEESLFCESDF